MFELEGDGSMGEEREPMMIWAAFGDLMACLLGLFVLFFVWVISLQVDLTLDLDSERSRRQEMAVRLHAIEEVLSGPLAAGLITLADGMIGIQGSVLFDLNSSQLSPDGSLLLGELAEPLRDVLSREDEVLMVSGFTDDLKVRGEPGNYSDNWELSTERALTVTRTLIAMGLEPNRVFVAGFASNYPLEPNDSESGRSRNRRVEISLISSPKMAR